MSFASSHPALARALAARGYTDPSSVQTAVMDASTGSRDLLVSAQTGSGKTIAFGLSIATTILGAEERFQRGAEPLALIIAPTRELALQVQRELAWLYAETGARIATCVGGMDPQAEARQLGAGTHIVVGTPGRLRDHIERRRLDLGQIKALVLDEADEMLDLGFREDLEFILGAAPKDRQTLLFSATIPREIEALARNFQSDAVRIEMARRDEQHADIDYQAVRVAPGDTEHAVVNLLRFHEARAAIVFCATREAVKRMHARLMERGFSAVALSGELTQHERTQALQALRDGRARVLVATDVAARGLDLPDLALVIHADLPNDRETLLHRSGRTGRAGKKGVSALIVPYNRRRKAEALVGAARLDVTWGTPPAAEEIRVRDSERFLADPVFTEAATPDEVTLARGVQAVRSAEEIALALVRMHRARLPAPEDLSPDTGPPRRDDRGHSGAKRFERPFERRQEASRSDRPDRQDRQDHQDRPGRHDRPERHEPSGPAGRGEGREPRPPRARREDTRDMVWFRLNIGRERNADPRWLVPLICKAGQISKAEIGAIKIFDRDTRFQILAEIADSFAAAARTSKDKEGHITRVGEFEPAASESRTALAEAAAPDQHAKKPHERRERPERSGDTPHASRPKAPWHDRKKSKGGGFTHRKGKRPDGAPHSSEQRAAQQDRPGSSKPPSKYAHKKKHRASDTAKT